MSQNNDTPSLSDTQTRALSDVLDDIIPPSSDGRLPGAGELGLARAIDEALGKTPELHAMIAAGLSALDELARRRGAQDFVALPRPTRQEVLAQLASLPEAFPPVLMLHTFAAYYQHARVVEALGLEARPPHPKGYTVDPNDLAMLDAVRRRPKMYREC